MSTVGVTWAERLAETAEGRVAYVDAPVSGSSAPAERGDLLVLASGEPALRERVQPVFDAVGRRTLWLDRPGDGSRLKLVLNNWLAVLTEGMAETLAFAEGLGLDPGSAVEAVGDSPLRSPYALTKGHAMVSGDFAPSFPLSHAHKDVGLALEAARRADVDLLLTEALLHRWDAAIKKGHGRDDIAAVFTQTRADALTAACEVITASAEQPSTDRNSYSEKHHS
jgi:3-hydroxyisobutyrate dehydrogenase